MEVWKDFLVLQGHILYTHIKYVVLSLQIKINKGYYFQYCDLSPTEHAHFYAFSPCI